ncbi:glycosyltransferase family 4 protein [Pseudarthrobacter oxydans]|uniref:glycosyltransferase family 4 protein n=1 Tax=Pseudarthrobacter oxydans TaxID=1671 RepID=UPI003830544C
MNETKLRVTILGLHYTPEPSGNAPYTTSLAEGLSKKGHAVKVVTGYPHYPEWTVNHDYKGWVLRESLNGVDVKRLRHYVPRRPSALGRLHMELSFGIRLLFAKWGKPDIVILVSPALFSTGLALIRARWAKRETRTIIWVQDIYSRGIVETGGQSGTASKLMVVIEGKLLGSVDRVVAIHERFAGYLADGLGVSADSIHVIRNWTHLPPAPDADRSTARQHFGWNERDIVALHTGNMGKKQGLGNVVEAARLAEVNGSRVRFVLMGDGNQRTALESDAQDLQRLDFIDSLPQEDFQAALQAADVLLVNELPGVRDMSVPSKLTSYFTSGRPVVAATDAGSVTSEEVAASGAGIRVDADDPASLVSTIESLGNDESLSKKLGDNGKRFREETLSETVAIGRYDDLITSLALSRGR